MRIVLRCLNVSKAFPSPLGGPEVRALHGVTLDVEEGESIAIVGPSGAGKSTLLSVMGTLEPPSAGVVEIAGRDVSRLTPRQLARLRNAEIGFVFQGHCLLPQLDVLENALVPAMAAPGGAARARGRALSLLERVGLADRLFHRPGELSGGECQRVALVRALVNSPSVVLADEPTGSLDSSSAGAMARLMMECNRELGVTLVVVTHSGQLASQMARTVRILDGALVGERA
jgi:lipoprotein-releasing system ATP-binding protein